MQENSSKKELIAIIASYIRPARLTEEERSRHALASRSTPKNSRQNLIQKIKQIKGNEKLPRPTRAELDVIAECIQYGIEVDPESRHYKKRLEHYKNQPGKSW